LFSAIKSWVGRGSPPPATPPSTEGRLVYAIGDVHGRNDLLLDLLDRIEADVRTPGDSPVADGFPPMLIFLGDYIDRGPDSRAVLDTVLKMKSRPDLEVRALKGNHEHQMLLFLEDAAAGPAWGAYGGREALMSYGIRSPAPQAPSDDWEATRLALVEALPAEHLALLQSLELTVSCGDYLFVHAGVRPGVPIEESSDVDLMMIRDEFLSYRKRLEKVVVHGHTPSAEPQFEVHRIGIDTGAYATGRLTALRLQGEARAILQSED
jgi:serine/threonine protein phosphatase 1